MLTKFDLIYVTELVNISGTGSTGCQLDLAVSEGVGRRHPELVGTFPQDPLLSYELTTILTISFPINC